jgi:hypothetical protein
MMRALLAIALAVMSHGVARRFTPYPDPGSLRPAWDFVQACSGAHPLPGHDFAQLTVLVSPYLLAGRHHIKGLWSEGDTIVIDSASVAVPWVIRHELLHALLQNPDHPMEPFAFPCKLLEVQQQ